MMDWNMPPGTFRMYGLPGSDLVPELRVCTTWMGEFSPLCWDGRRWPAFDPLAISPGETLLDVDFCVGNQPIQEVTGLRVGKSDGNVTFFWDFTSDPYQDRYRLRGAFSLQPSSPPGSFPDDPYFGVVYEGWDNYAELPSQMGEQYFLVTNVGVTGNEGPQSPPAP